jgi:hypothetical protein
MMADESRFSLCHSPRRSGKTEGWKRKLVKRAHKFKNRKWRGRFAFLAPTHKQAMSIAWNDLIALTDGLTGREKPNKSEQRIPLWNADIFVAGMDKPERIEGQPLDGAVCDEYGNMKKEAWPLHIRPCLSTPGRLGWGAFIGVPEGRNHYYEKKLQYEELGRPVYWWDATEVLDLEEIEEARKELSELEFKQEYGGEFVAYGGLAYYEYREALHKVPCKHLYNPLAELNLCLDFNIAPGVAALIQVMDRDELGLPKEQYSKELDAIIGEVWIPKNSTTPSVMRKVFHDWINQIGLLRLFGDATGGAGGTAKVAGSDWEIIESMCNMKGINFENCVLSENPRERQRINCFNSRLKTSDGLVHTIIDPSCKFVVLDIEGTKTLEGGAGELDKKSDKNRTHMTDAIGYYYWAEHRADETITSVSNI